MVVAASSSLLRICEANCIVSDAFSTAVTACVGSLSCPVASALEVAVALACVCSSELIAFASAPPKPPPEFEPVLTALVDGMPAPAPVIGLIAPLAKPRAVRSHLRSEESLEQVQGLGVHRLGGLHRRHIRLV